MARTSTDSLTDRMLNASFNRRSLLAMTSAGVVLPHLMSPALSFAQEGSPGGTATLVLGANPASWDLTTSTWITWQGVNFLYDRLLNFDENENLTPGLATEWSVSEDGLEYTLMLREGVQFHDGTPFNAEAVQFNIQRHIDKPVSAFNAAFSAVERIDLVDDSTVTIVLGETRPNFIYEGLAQWGALQLSPTSYAEQDPDNYGNPPVGTGPFVFESYEPGSLIVYKRNDNYWAGAPLLDEVRVKIIPEPAVQLTEIEAGAADWILLNPKDVGTAEDIGLVVESNITPGSQFISLNVSRGVTSELAVRKAIALAIDRDTLIEALAYGYAEKSRAGVNEVSRFYDESIPMIEYDPDEAGRVLDGAGWALADDGVRERDGEKLVVSILSTDFVDWGLYNQAIQEQLKQVGIDSTITSLEWNAYLDQWRENQGDWQVTYHSQGSIMAATAPIQASWAPSNFWSITQIDDATTPELMALSEQLEALYQEFLTVVDETRQKEIASEAQALFQENQLTVWLWHAATLAAIQPRLKGYTLTHSGRVLELPAAFIEE